MFYLLTSLRETHEDGRELRAVLSVHHDMICVGVLYGRVLNCYREVYLLVTVRADVTQTQGTGLVAMTDPVVASAYVRV